MTTKYTPQWSNAHFGYVWIITDNNDRTYIGHPGSSSGWQSMNAYYPKQEYTVIILTNFGFVNQFELLDKIENSLFNKF